MRCKCGSTMIRLKTEHKCLKCGLSKPRFITPEVPTLFLTVETKRPEDRKYLENIMNPKPRPRRRWYFGPGGEIFVRVEGQKYLEVYTQEQWAKKLVAEMERKHEEFE